MPSLTCVICNGELPPQKPGARRIACPGACAAERARQKMQEHYQQQKTTPEGVANLKVTRARSYKRWREAHPEDVAARMSAWRNANADKMAASNLAYRRANADKVREKNLRRRARLLNAFVEDVGLGELWDRDTGTCGICSIAVNPDLAWPDKMSKTLDHIIPLSRGGEHSWANAQLAHAVCNSRKNNFITA